MRRVFVTSVPLGEVWLWSIGQDKTRCLGNFNVKLYVGMSRQRDSRESPTGVTQRCEVAVSRSRCVCAWRLSSLRRLRGVVFVASRCVWRFVFRAMTLIGMFMAPLEVGNYNLG